MRWSAILLIAALAVLAAVAIWYATGGRFVFFFLPLLFGLPLLRRRRSTPPPARGPDRR